MTIEGKWFDDLDAVATDAAGALDRAHQPSLYNRLDWFRLTHVHIVPKAKLAIARVRKGPSAVWLFLIEASRRRAVPFASWYTLRFAPVLSDEAASHLLPALQSLAADRFDHIAFHPLTHPIEMPGWHSFHDRPSANWTMDIPTPDFATYWATRPTALRQTIARQTKNHPLAIEIHRAFDPRIWADYEDVYRDSWKPAEGSFPFLRALAEQEGRAGTLRLGLGRDEAGRAIAAQLWLVENGIATIHKLAHREQAKADSPGSQLTHALFREAIAVDQVHRIDFGLGDEPYKADWVSTRLPIWRTQAYQIGTVRGTVGLARAEASQLARRLSHGYRAWWRRVS